MPSLHQSAEDFVRPLRSRRNALYVVELILIVGFLVCLGTLFQTAALSGAPNYSLERAEYNFRLWGTLGFIFFFASIWGGIYLWRISKKYRELLTIAEEYSETHKRIETFEQRATRKKEGDDI